MFSAIKHKITSIIPMKVRKRQGQVFIMACLVIGVYIISLLSSITAVSVTIVQQAEDEEKLSIFLTETKREIKNKLIMYLRQYTQQGDNLTFIDTIINDLSTELDILTTYGGMKGLYVNLDFASSSLSLTAKNIDAIENVTDNIYRASVRVNISYSISNTKKSVEITGNTLIGVQYVVEKQNNIVTVTETTQTGTIIDYCNTATVQLIGADNLIANSLNNGTYSFAVVPADVYLNVTLQNGIRVYS